MVCLAQTIRDSVIMVCLAQTIKGQCDHGVSSSDY